MEKRDLWKIAALSAAVSSALAFGATRFALARSEASHGIHAAHGAVVILHTRPPSSSLTRSEPSGITKGATGRP